MQNTNFETIRTALNSRRQAVEHELTLAKHVQSKGKPASTKAIADLEKSLSEADEELEKLAAAEHSASAAAEEKLKKEKADIVEANIAAVEKSLNARLKSAENIERLIKELGDEYANFCQLSTDAQNVSYEFGCEVYNKISKRFEQQDEWPVRICNWLAHGGLWDVIESPKPRYRKPEDRSITERTKLSNSLILSDIEESKGDKHE